MNKLQIIDIVLYSTCLCIILVVDEVLKMSEFGFIYREKLRGKCVLYLFILCYFFLYCSITSDIIFFHSPSFNTAYHNSALRGVICDCFACCLVIAM